MERTPIWTVALSLAIVCLWSVVLAEEDLLSRLQKSQGFGEETNFWNEDDNFKFADFGKVSSENYDVNYAEDTADPAQDKGFQENFDFEADNFDTPNDVYGRFNFPELPSFDHSPQMSFRIPQFHDQDQYLKLDDVIKDQAPHEEVDIHLPEPDDSFGDYFEDNSAKPSYPELGGRRPSGFDRFEDDRLEAYRPPGKVQGYEAPMRNQYPVRVLKPVTHADQTKVQPSRAVYSKPESSESSGGYLPPSPAPKYTKIVKRPMTSAYKENHKVYYKPISINSKPSGSEKIHPQGIIPSKTFDYDSGYKTSKPIQEVYYKPVESSPPKPIGTVYYKTNQGHPTPSPVESHKPSSGYQKPIHKVKKDPTVYYKPIEKEPIEAVGEVYYKPLEVKRPLRSDYRRPFTTSKPKVYYKPLEADGMKLPESSHDIYQSPPRKTSHDIYQSPPMKTSHDTYQSPPRKTTPPPPSTIYAKPLSIVPPPTDFHPQTLSKPYYRPEMDENVSHQPDPSPFHSYFNPGPMYNESPSHSQPTKGQHSPPLKKRRRKTTKTRPEQTHPNSMPTFSSLWHNLGSLFSSKTGKAAGANSGQTDDHGGQSYGKKKQNKQVATYQASSPEIDSGYVSTHGSAEVPDLIKKLATCIPISLLAALVPIGILNLNPPVATITVGNPATLTQTVTVTVTANPTNP